jgi:predicted nuclease of predicted toxin-antitoxin system
VRFILDENVPLSLSGVLRERGHDVVHVAEAYPSLPDPDIHALALREQRVIVTQDIWFGDFTEQHGMEQPGTILIRPKRLTGQEVIELVTRTVLTEADALIGKLTIIDRRRVRTVDFDYPI